MACLPTRSPPSPPKRQTSTVAVSSSWPAAKPAAPCQSCVELSAIDDRFALANVALAVAEDAVRQRRRTPGGDSDALRRSVRSVAANASTSPSSHWRSRATWRVRQRSGANTSREFAADILVLHVLTGRGVDVADLDKDHAVDMSQVDRHVVAETDDGTFRPS